MPTTPDLLVRLCEEDEWLRARERGFVPPDPGGDFVHLSTVEQVHLPANRLYRGRDDLMLLYLDATALNAPLRWEPGVPTDPDSMLFPHLYGPLPVSAVVRTASYRPGADGRFLMVLGGQDAGPGST